MSNRQELPNNITKEQFRSLMMEVSKGFKCIVDCKCVEILGYDCGDNDNHCVLADFIFKTATEMSDCNE